MLVVTDTHVAQARAYRIHLAPNAVDGGYMAVSPDFPGLVGAGETHGAAAEDLVSAIATALAHAAELGRPAPAPAPVNRPTAAPPATASAP